MTKDTFTYYKIEDYNERLSWRVWETYPSGLYFRSRERAVAACRKLLSDPDEQLRWTHQGNPDLRVAEGSFEIVETERAVQLRWRLERRKVRRWTETERVIIDGVEYTRGIQREEVIEDWSPPPTSLDSVILSVEPETIEFSDAMVEP